MQNIIIQASGEIPTEFQGELEKEWSGQWINGRDRNRYHTVDLYRTDENILVLVITWHTHWQGESDNVQILDCEDEAEILPILDTIDPLEHLVGYPKGEHFANKQITLERQITDDWRQLKGEIASDLGIKKPLVRRGGRPPHPLGTCSNPGWSIPQQVIETIAKLATDLDTKPSAIVTEALVDHFNIGAKNNALS